MCISTKLQACLSRYDLLLPPGIKRLIIFRETSRYKKLARGKDKIDKIYILAWISKAIVLVHILLFKVVILFIIKLHTRINVYKIRVFESGHGTTSPYPNMSDWFIQSQYSPQLFYHLAIILILIITDSEDIKNFLPYIVL